MQQVKQQYVIPMDFYEIKFTEVIHQHSRRLNSVIDFTTHIGEILRGVFGLEPREGLRDGDFKYDLVAMGVPPVTADLIIISLLRFLEHALVDLLEEKAHYDNYSWEYHKSGILVITSVEYENSSDKPQRALS